MHAVQQQPPDARSGSFSIAKVFFWISFAPVHLSSSKVELTNIACLSYLHLLDDAWAL